MRRFPLLRRLGRYSLLAFLGLLLLISAFLWYITTDSFQQMVRHRLIAAIEHATGGRAEIGSFHVVPLRFEVEVRNLTIHGRESAGERPFVQVDSMSAVVDLTSVIGVRMGFHSLVLSHPVVHLIYYPDGSTNQPIPPKSSSASFEQLFSISINRLEVRSGELFVQEQRVPVEFVTDDVRARVNYSFLHQRYSGALSVGKAETQFSGFRPFTWAAKTEFSIGKDEVQLRSLTLNSEKSSIRGAGVLSDFRNPQFKGTYDISLDLQQAGAIAREPRASSGKLQVRGSATWSSQNFATGGDFDLKDFSWKDRLFTAKDLSALGRFSLDPRKIALSQVQGRFLRGTFVSEAEISGWQTPANHAGTKKQSSQHGSVVLKVRDMSVAELIASLGPQFRDVRALRLSGILSGNTDVRWKDSIRNAEASSVVSITRPTRLSAGELPLDAKARFSYRTRPAAIDIAELTASTPATQLRASGALSKTSSLRLSLVSDNVNEWRSLTSTPLAEGLPVTISGHAAFSGTLTGSLSSPVISGDLQVHDFDTSVPGAGSRRSIVHWDSLNSGLQLSAANLTLHNALFRRNDSSVRLDGTVGLSDWKTEPNGTIHLTTDAQNLDANDLVTLTGQTLQATGKLNAHLEISGTTSKPQGQGTVNWANGSLQGFDFGSLNSSLAVAPHRVAFRTLEITRGRSHVSGNGWYDLATQAFQGELNGTNFDLSDVSPLERSRIKIAGAVDFTAGLSGTVAKPDVAAHLHIRDLAFNDEKAGDYRIDAVTHGADMQLTGHSEFGVAELQIGGNVRLREQWPARINLHFNRLDVDSFLESYLHGHITGHSAVAGDLVLEGPLRDPRRLALIGNLTDLFADLEKMKIRNDGPLQFTLTGEVLSLKSLHVIGENTDFSANGSIQLGGERQLNLHGSGKIGLQLVQTYDPDLTGSGTATGEVSVTGTSGSPVVRGTLLIQNAAIADINLPSALSELNGLLHFSQNQITIEKLTGKTGGGTVSFTGHAELIGRQLNFDLFANAESVRLRYPPGVSSTATAELRWSGSSSGSLLSGDITVTKLGVMPGFDFGAYLQRTIQSSTLPQTDPVLNNIRLDLHVVTTPELQMQTSVLLLRGNADLRVRGSAAKPVLLGRAEVFEGQAYFQGTKYRLERGGVSFGTPTSTSATATSVPFIDLQATTHVRDYDITLSITGPANSPKLNYRSEPPLPTNDIIGLLAFGQTSEESAQLQQSNQSAFSQQASNAMLAAALNATLNNRTQKLFGNSRVKIDPQGLETETSPTQSGPAVTIEQQVKDNLTLTYTTNVAQTSQQIIRAEYYVSRNVSIVAIRDQNGVVSFDVKIRRRKR